MKLTIIIFLSLQILGGNMLSGSSLAHSTPPDSCECVQFKNANLTEYLPFEELFPYSELETLKNWNIEGFDNTYNQWYYKLFSTNINKGSTVYELDLASTASIRITPRLNEYSFIINPCADNNNASLLHLRIIHSNNMYPYNPYFDPDKFDYSAVAYLRLMADLYPDDGDFLISILNDDFMMELKTLVAECNRSYPFHLKYFPENHSKTIEELLLKLNENTIEHADFIAERIINNTPGIHPVDQIESSGLEHVFNYYKPKFQLESLDRFIHPNIAVHIFTKKIELELSPGILRQWDFEKNKAVYNSEGLEVTAPLSVNTKAIVLTSSMGADGLFYDVCMPTTEISETGILINMTRIDLVNAKRGLPFAYDFDLYPFYKIDSSNFIVSPSAKERYNYEYSPALVNFSGIYAENAELKILTSEGTLESQGHHIILNNLLYAGVIIFPKVQDAPPNTEVQYLVKRNGKIIKMTIDELKIAFNSVSQTTDLQFNPTENKLTIHFAKRAVE